MTFGFWAALWFFDVFHDSQNVTSTALEVKRLKRWLCTITASRHLPISWASRCAVLLRTRSQFTWGTGSHSLVMTSSHNNELNTLRSGILRCLLRRDKYVVSPGIYFALLASPSLCPQFCRVMDGIITIWRTLRSSDRWSAVTAAFFFPQPPPVDGPITFLRQVDSMDDFAGIITSLLQNCNVDFNQWIHEARGTWRHAQFVKVSRDRPVFRAVETGVLRDETLAHLFQLQQDGWSADNVDPTPCQEDCRQRAAILRLLLSGGLFTQNVISTHMHRKETHCDCSVGGVMDVECGTYFVALLSLFSLAYYIDSCCLEPC